MVLCLLTLTNFSYSAEFRGSHNIVFHRILVQILPISFDPVKQIPPVHGHLPPSTMEESTSPCISGILTPTYLNHPNCNQPSSSMAQRPSLPSQISSRFCLSCRFLAEIQVCHSFNSTKPLNKIPPNKTWIQDRLPVSPLPIT